MDTQRLHIVVPRDLVDEIDSFAGRRGRSAFFLDLARSEVRRRRLLAFLDDPKPVWKDADHPELAKLGTVAWLKKQREHTSDRQKWLEKKWYNRK